MTITPAQLELLSNELIVDAFNEMINPQKISKELSLEKAFGPCPGDVYLSAAIAEQRIAIAFAEIISFSERNDFFSFLADSSIDGDEKFTSKLSDKKKIETYSTWQLDYQTRLMMKWLYMPRYDVDLPITILNLLGFRPGLAVLAYRDPQALSKIVDSFFDYAFGSSPVTKDELYRLSKSEKLAWVSTWRETAFCHVEPLSKGLPQELWGEVILPQGQR